MKVLAFFTTRFAYQPAVKNIEQAEDVNERKQFENHDFFAIKQLVSG